MNSFELVLTDEEKRFCKDLVVWVIRDHLGLASEPRPVFESRTLSEELGA